MMARSMPVALRGLMPLLLMLLLTPEAGAQGRNRNAATLYLKAIDALEKIPESDLDVVATWSRTTGGIPGPEVRRVVGRAQSVINYARRGSNLPTCDFDLNYGEGFELQLPHLGRLRTVTRLMRAQAMIDLDAGRKRSAAEMLAAVYRVGEHTKNDKILISSLVGAAISRGGDREVGWAMDRGAFEASESAMLLDALNDFNAADPFGIGESIAMEREVAIDWLDSRFHDDDGELMAQEMAESLGFDGEVSEDIVAMDEGQFRDDLSDYDAAMDQVVEAYALEDPEAAKAALARIGEEVVAGEHGALAAVMMPAFDRLYDIAQASKAVLDERKEALEAIATEKERPEDLANAVVFYLRAIEKLHALEHLDQLRAFDADPSQVISVEVMALIDGSDEVFSLLREAATKRRCDFTHFRLNGRVTIAQVYTPGFRDLFRLLHTAAQHAYRQGKFDAAHESLVLAASMCGHLGLDETIVSSLVAHKGLERTADLMKQGLDMKAFDEDARAELLKALDSIGRKDPFGYIGAVVRSREPAQQLFTGNTLKEEDVKVVKRWNGDQHLYLAVVYDTMLRASETSKPHPVDLVPLADVLDMKAVEAARNEVDLIAPHMQREDLGVFDGRSIPSIGDVPGRMRAARATLREAAAPFRDKMEATAR